MSDKDVEGNRNFKDQSNAFLQMMRNPRNPFKSSEEKPADQDSVSSDSDNELWYSESSSDSEDDYYYQRREYCLSDSEDEVAESAIDKPKSLDKKNVLDDYWIHDIETPLKCNGENCSKKKIKGLWYTHDKKDYCSDCSALLEFETYNIFEPTLAEKKGSKMRTLHWASLKIIT